MKSMTLLAVLLAAVAAPKRPPATVVGNAVSVFYRVAVRDPYRWLEDSNSPAVRAWIKDQNAWTDQNMRGFAEGKAMSKEVQRLSLTSPQNLEPRLVGKTLFYLRETPPEAQPVLVCQPWPEGAVKVLVDTNASGGNVGIYDYWPSRSGRYVAYGTAAGGSEKVILHLFDVAKGEELPELLPFAGGGTTGPGVLWDADENGFTYVRLPLPGSVPEGAEEFGASLYHHLLRTPPGEDQPVFGQGFSPVAEYVLLDSANGHRAAALVQEGDGSFYSVFDRDGKGKWKKVLGPEGGVVAGCFDQERLLLIATAGSDRGRLVAVDADGKISTLVPEEGWSMQAVAPVEGGFLLTRVNGPAWRIDHYSRDGQLIRTIPLPDESVASIVSEADSPDVLLSLTGWIEPPRWEIYDARTGARKTIFSVKVPGKYSHIEISHLEAVSQDGTRIPVTVLALPGTPRNGEAPTILTGYGGFRLPVAPTFIGPYLAWLEHGGVYAVANIRGGDEFGEAWHRQGMLTHKRNVFDDFYAAARELVSAGWTRPEKMGILGGSNGGLLMGAELAEHPEQFRAVVSFVGIYDMLRHELWPNGRYNVSEYGTVTDPAQFLALLAYSPLQNLRSGVKYPAVLLETGVNDPRVAPWQSRKFAAALQAARAGGNPVLLLTRSNAGHGIGAPFAQRVGNTALALTFFAHELGLKN